MTTAVSFPLFSTRRRYYDYSLDPRAAIVLDLVPRASAHQADEARPLNF